MSTRKTSAQGDSCALSVGESLLSQQELSAPESTGTTDESTGQLAGDAQDDAQRCIDAAQAHLHLDLLGLDERVTNIRGIPHKGKKGPAFNGVFGQDLERAEEWQRIGMGIYLQVNPGGTKVVEIERCTALFFEHDNIPRWQQVTIYQDHGLPQPSFMVDTSGNSIHHYYVLKEPISVQLWTEMMERLHRVAKGCDTSCKGANRLMRMAGSWYIDRNGNAIDQAEILWPTDRRFDIEEFQILLPPLPESKPQPAVRKRFTSGRHNSLPLREIVNALEAIPQRVEGSGTYADYRDILWGLMAACRDIGVDEQVAIDLMEAHSPSHLCGWDVEQVARSGGEQIGAGTLFFHAKQHGWSRYAR